MKIYLMIIFLSLSFITAAQNKLNFTYDPKTGSQTVRELCLTCSSTKHVKDIKEIEAITQEDLQKFSSEDVISYYPNPVKEELYLKWELVEGNKVSSIQVFSITGQVLQNYQGKDHTDTVNIPFQQYGTGVYLVQLNYAKGEPKTIKIIKQ